MPLHTLFVCLEGPSSLLALTDSYVSFHTQLNWPFLWKVCFDILTDHNHSPLLEVIIKARDCLIPLCAWCPTEGWAQGHYLECWALLTE